MTYLYYQRSRYGCLYIFETTTLFILCLKGSNEVNVMSACQGVRKTLSEVTSPYCRKIVLYRAAMATAFFKQKPVICKNSTF